MALPSLEDIWTEARIFVELYYKMGTFGYLG